MHKKYQTVSLGRSALWLGVFEEGIAESAAAQELEAGLDKDSWMIGSQARGVVTARITQLEESIDAVAVSAALRPRNSILTIPA